MKPVVVISFPRSGTHFLLNSIGANFAYASAGSDVLNVPSQITFDNYCRAPHRLRKSHQTAEQVYPCLDNLLLYHHVFYIYRDPRAVAVSLWHYQNEVKTFRNFKTVEDMLKSDHIDGIFGKPFSSWKPHVEGWFWLSALKGNIHLISYEELWHSFDNTISWVGGVIGQPIPRKIIRPGVRDGFSVNPWIGRPDTWKDYLTERQSNQLASFIPVRHA